MVMLLLVLLLGGVVRVWYGEKRERKRRDRGTDEIELVRKRASSQNFVPAFMLAMASGAQLIVIGASMGRGRGRLGASGCRW
jgi:hypothetical protein